MSVLNRDQSGNENFILIIGTNGSVQQKLRSYQLSQAIKFLVVFKMGLQLGAFVQGDLDQDQ